LGKSKTICFVSQVRGNNLNVIFCEYICQYIWATSTKCTPPALLHKLFSQLSHKLFLCSLDLVLINHFTCVVFCDDSCINQSCSCCRCSWSQPYTIPYKAQYLDYHHSLSVLASSAPLSKLHCLIPELLELGDGHLFINNRWLEKSICFAPLTNQTREDVTHQLVHWVVPPVIFTLIPQVAAIPQDIPHSWQFRLVFISLTKTMTKYVRQRPFFPWLKRDDEFHFRQEHKSPDFKIKAPQISLFFPEE